MDETNPCHVVCGAPAAGKTTGVLREGDGWVFTHMALTPDNTELWLTDRTAEKPGIRIFDTVTDAEITEEPINVGLPPSAICFAE